MVIFREQVTKQRVCGSGMGIKIHIVKNELKI